MDTQDDSTRIERLIDVLSLLSLGEYAPALAHIDISASQDRLAVVEQGLAMFVQELADAREENGVYVTQLEQSKREIEQKLEMIDQQQLAIRELSTPIIELWDDILTLPIVGSIDTDRSMEMTERLLERISSTRARCVIIDVTGVHTIDTMTANHFTQMIRAARLLGAYCVVTGMSPDIARTLVDLGVDLDTSQTLRSLRDGLKHCLRFMHGHGSR